jgi:hypothetical protein
MVDFPHNNVHNNDDLLFSEVRTRRFQTALDARFGHASSREHRIGNSLGYTKETIC